MAKSEVGKVGVSLSNLAEAELLFDGLDLANLSTSFTINGTASIIYAVYLAVADDAALMKAGACGIFNSSQRIEDVLASIDDLLGA